MSSLDDERERDEQSQTRRFTWFDNLPMSTRRGGSFINFDVSHKSTNLPWGIGSHFWTFGINPMPSLGVYKIKIVFSSPSPCRSCPWIWTIHLASSHVCKSKSKYEYIYVQHNPKPICIRNFNRLWLGPREIDHILFSKSKLHSDLIYPWPDW